MLTLLQSIRVEHDLTLLLVAAAICVIGSVATFLLWSYVREMRGTRRLAWMSIAALTAASTVWSTHFVGTLAYSYDMGRGLSLAWTAISMIVAVTLSFIATLALTRDRSDAASCLVTAVALTAAIAGMHYSGVMAYSASALIYFDHDVVAASLAAAFVCNLIVAVVFQRRGRASPVAVPAALTLGVLLLHLFGMSGMMLEPCFPDLAFAAGVPPWLALTVIATVGIIIAAAGAAMAVDRAQLRRRSLEADRLAALADTLAEARDAAERATQAKSRFLAHMSHEFRTPLNGILGMTEALSLTALDSEQKDCASIIQSSGQALLRIVDEVLDLARIEADRVELASAPFDLLTEIEDAVALMNHAAESKGLRLHLRYRPDVPRRMQGDAGRVRQIVLNLLGNALKFTQEGHILVDVSRREDGDGVAIRVTDTGIGIPTEKTHGVFESFGQAHDAYGGTGLGLAISRSLARLMGGDITISRTGPNGTTLCAVMALPALAGAALEPAAPGRFAVVVDDPLEREILVETAAALGAGISVFASLAELGTNGADGFSGVIVSGTADVAILSAAVPALVVGSPADAGPRPAAALHIRFLRPVRRDRLTAWLTHPDRRPADAAPLRIGRPAAANPFVRRILIADDSLVNRTVIRKMLGTGAFEIVEVGDGAEAVDAARDARFDAILMDVSMPRMDGMEATARIRARDDREGRAASVILGVTGHALESDIARFLASGMDDVILKPLQRGKLLDAIEARCGVAARDVA